MKNLRFLQIQIFSSPGPLGSGRRTRARRGQSPCAPSRAARRPEISKKNV